MIVLLNEDSSQEISIHIWKSLLCCYFVQMIHNLMFGFWNEKFFKSIRACWMIRKPYDCILLEFRQNSLRESQFWIHKQIQSLNWLGHVDHVCGFFEFSFILLGLCNNLILFAISFLAEYLNQWTKYYILVML